MSADLDRATELAAEALRNGGWSRRTIATAVAETVEANGLRRPLSASDALLVAATVAEALR
jgi:hypothetical protein